MAVVHNVFESDKRKRHLWLVSLTFPLIPLLGIAAAETLNSVYMLWLPVIILYIVLPVLDYVVGVDKADILGTMETEASLSPFYKYMVHGLLPLIYFCWLIGAYYAATQDLPIGAYIALGISHGWGLAFAINCSLSLWTCRYTLYSFDVVVFCDGFKCTELYCALWSLARETCRRKIPAMSART